MKNLNLSIKCSYSGLNYCVLFILILLVFLSCDNNKNTEFKKAELIGHGFHGYVGYNAKPDTAYGMGVSFYTAAWPLIDQPLHRLQIGLPGTWIIPKNSDNKTIEFCPEGTTIHQVTAFGPTYQRVFQTLEGGLGYWARNKYRYGPPKFSMNSTPQCYDYEVATPGWSFFYDDKALADSLLGVAQLSNRLLIPPDALPFEGNPNGEFMGYAYMALPFTDAYHNTKVQVGNQNWTCFINTENFKGPIAYYLPETWSKFSEQYPEIEGRGLDAREGIINGGAMEINTVPSFRQYDNDSTLYVKIPKLNFPIDSAGKASLVQDLRYYNKNALFNEILDWRKNGVPSDGKFKYDGMTQPKMDSTFSSLDIYGTKIKGVETIFKPFTDNTSFGYDWKNTAFQKGTFPEYYKQEGDAFIIVEASKVPKNLGLIEAEFPIQENTGTYFSPEEGSWMMPGAASGPYEATLNDGSTVIYYWYKFIDQPVFGQFNWSEDKKLALQSLIEKIHE
ncbi:hypothetical protein, partial [Paucihalobacter sp.]|uniref:hypothetical protein n=1 Tax=Paucihalobacter sp. TaxID=2850405 RepID=UPI002FE346D1